MIETKMGHVDDGLPVVSATSFEAVGDSFLTLKLRYQDGSDVVLYLKDRQQMGQLAADIAQAVEGVTGFYLINRECSCGKHLGKTFCGDPHAVSTGLCPECAAKLDEQAADLERELDEGPHDTADRDWREGLELDARARG